MPSRTKRKAHAVIDQLSKIIGGLSDLDKKLRSGGTATLTKRDREAVAAAATLLDVNATPDDLAAGGDVLRTLAKDYTRGPQSAKERLKAYEPLAISKFRKVELAATNATTFSDAVEAASHAAKTMTEAQVRCLRSPRRRPLRTRSALALQQDRFAKDLLRREGRDQGHMHASHRRLRRRTWRLRQAQDQALRLKEVASRRWRGGRARRQGRAQRLGAFD